ncbi:Hypothetical_protein [Hexamita inflata]|uniref:Hypothetical_protein n=1 Tax=Hexamita inflata TaxID=28002 RepID=A0AA86QRT8_9EUKA|nr:Hypothetical protein HINF_LOCUS47966 [Hexamita inflata]
MLFSKVVVFDIKFLSDYVQFDMMQFSKLEELAFKLFVAIVMLLNILKSKVVVFDIKFLSDYVQFDMMQFSKLEEFFEIYLLISLILLYIYESSILNDVQIDFIVSQTGTKPLSIN